MSSNAAPYAPGRPDAWRLTSARVSLGAIAASRLPELFKERRHEPIGDPVRLGPHAFRSIAKRETRQRLRWACGENCGSQFVLLADVEQVCGAPELYGFDKRPDANTLNRLSERYPEAKARAEALDKMHGQNHSPEGSNPSTSIPPLIDIISA